MTMIKHSDRALRKPCAKCGQVGTNEDGHGLYWYHDMDATKVSRPCAEHNHGSQLPINWTICDAYGNVHDCQAGQPSSSPVPAKPTYEANVPEPTPVPSPDANGSGNPANAANLFQQLMAELSPTITKADVVKMITDANADYKADLLETVGMAMADKLAKVTVPTTVNVIRPELPPITITNVHKSLKLVLTDLSAGEHVMMVGPAGTGKSTIAKQCAQALGFAFYAISLSPQTPASQLLGYMNATGDYVRSLFRNAYEHGGVFHFDEFDNGNPSILALINAALANGQMAFPDGMVARHADFRCVASANTYGRGPDRKYVGRQAIDLATLDRFTVEEVGYDNALEQTLCLMTGLEAIKVEKVLEYVRVLRSNAEKHQMAVIFSPRASVGMCRLVHAGRSVGDAIKVRVRRGLSDADWNKVTTGSVAPKF